jgi:hypothetical protein
VFTKNLSFLLQLLRTSKQSGMLVVEPPGSHKSSWLGQFHLDKGVVVTCVIRNKADGRVLLSNDEAVRWLGSQGGLEWYLEEEQVPPPEEAPPLRPAPEQIRSEQHRDPAALLPAMWKNQMRAIPRRTEKGKDVPLSTFASRDLRQVYTLIDGRRTIEEIVVLLHKPPDVIIRVLQVLHAAGFII